jgi:hypothetical protein
VASASGSLPSGFDGANGGTYDQTIYGLASGVTLPAGKGTEYVSRDGYHQSFKGFEVSATKRMSNHWMARFGFATNSWREYFDNPATAITDPTSTLANPNIDGGYVVTASSGSGKSGIYSVQPKFQFNANGAYEAPHGINLGVNWVMRQGYPMPWYKITRNIPDPFATTKNVLYVSDFGQDRLPAVGTFDFRVGKVLHFSKMTANVDFDIFNLFNQATVLGRQYDASRTTGNTAYTNVMEILQPRIARIGMRLSF